MWEVLQEWTFETIEQHDHCFLFLKTTRAEFYRVLMNPLLHNKFVRVNDTLNAELIGFNKKESTKIRRKPKEFVPHLAESKQAEKYKWRKNSEVIERDKKKPLMEIGIHNGKQSQFSQSIVAYSRKSVKRILGFGYVSEQGKYRVYVRHSTLTEHPRSAESVIGDIRKNLGLPVMDISSISE